MFRRPESNISLVPDIPDISPKTDVVHKRDVSDKADVAPKSDIVHMSLIW